MYMEGHTTVGAASQCYWDELMLLKCELNAIKVWANAIKVWANAIKIQDQHKKNPQTLY